MSGLWIAAPDLARLIESADAQHQRRAAVVAARYALERAEVTDSEAHAALDAVDSETIDDGQREAASQLAERLDDAYLDVLEFSTEEEQAVMMRMFRRARAASSAWNATEPDARQAALDAVYEASNVPDDPDELFALVRAELIG